MVLAREGAVERRSPVPDLIYPEVRDPRIAELGPLVDDPAALGPAAPLHRITAFVTYRCQLDCPYCKTIVRAPADLERLPQRASTIGLAELERMLDGHRDTPIRHVHFTGGEAMLSAELPAMVARVRARGVPHASATSNGVVPLARLVAVLEAGLSELRLSIDADDPALGARLSGRPRAFATAVDNLVALGERKRALGFVLIANVVVTLDNRARLPEIVRFLLARGADDVKLITEVDLRGRLGDFPERPAVERELSALVSEAPAHRPLLARKLRTVFADDAIGLEGAPPGLRCYVPLTERTVDGRHYYPCSVYLREGGRPLGAVDEPEAEKRRRSAEFVLRGDCGDDPICRRYCLHCTRDYNLAIHEVRR